MEADADGVTSSTPLIGTETTGSETSQSEPPKAESAKPEPVKPASFKERAKGIFGKKKQKTEDSEKSAGADDGFVSWIEDPKRPKKSCACCACGSCCAFWDDRFTRWAIIVFLTLAFLAVAAVLIWHFVLLALISRLQVYQVPDNGVKTIVDRLAGTPMVIPTEPYWVEDFTRDVLPVQCHSHNDYERDVPLYDALQAGCTSVEADINVVDNDLYVDHAHLTSAAGVKRTLNTMYINPILTILQRQNGNASNTVAPTRQDASRSDDADFTTTPWKGVFDTHPNQTLTLLCDFKNDGATTLPVLMRELQPLRDAGYLTGYNTTSGAMRWGPVTVVASGNAPFDLLNVANPSGVPGYDMRDVFFDAPLLNLTTTGAVYNASNSYFASVRLSDAVGRVAPTGMTSDQRDRVRAQLKVATDLGLLGRYWSTPTWPVSNMVRTWKVFVDEGIGMLNVDDLVLATRWDWQRCNVMGLDLC